MYLRITLPCQGILCWARCTSGSLCPAKVSCVGPAVPQDHSAPARSVIIVLSPIYIRATLLLPILLSPIYYIPQGHCSCPRYCHCVEPHIPQGHSAPAQGIYCIVLSPIYSTSGPLCFYRGIINVLSPIYSTSGPLCFCPGIIIVLSPISIRATLLLPKVISLC